MDETEPTSTGARDLEAETAHKINMLVRRANVWVPKPRRRDAVDEAVAF